MDVEDWASAGVFFLVLINMSKPNNYDLEVKCLFVCYLC